VPTVEANTPDESGLSPAEWQGYVNRLAAADATSRGEGYQRFPDETHGDGGLEGITTDGHAFQAYYPEAGKTAPQLKQALCKKITDDLEKLERYKEFWSGVLQGRVIRFWRMVVPQRAFRNKHVVSHATGRARHCVSRNLCFVDPNLQALVSVPEDFASATRVLAADRTVSPPLLEANETVLRAFEEERRSTVSRLDAKLKKLPKLYNEERVTDFRRQMLRRYLDYTSAMEWLGRFDPTARERIIAKREGVRRSVETENLVSAAQPPERLQQARLSFKKELDEVAPFIESTRRNDISWGVVGEWLLECPLDFPE
jgi:hypothetical protein